LIKALPGWRRFFLPEFYLQVFKGASEPAREGVRPANDSLTDPPLFASRLAPTNQNSLLNLVFLQSPS
jgi:hypothetical protein